jgi:hypothetical protein
MLLCLSYGRTKRGCAVLQEESRLRRVALWVLLTLVVTAATLTALSDVAEALLRILKAWRSLAG